MIISTCNHKHIDGYDTMYPCSEFVVKIPKKHTKMQKIIKYISTCNHYTLIGMIQRITVEKLKKF